MGFVILAVDGSGFVLRQIRHILGGDHDVRTVRASTDLFSQLDGQTPDLILLGLDAPDDNGCLFLQHVHTSKQFTHIPVIVMAGANRRQMEAWAFGAGAADFIQKPLSEVILKKKVKFHLERLQRYRDAEHQMSLSRLQFSVAMSAVQDVDKRTRAMLDAAPFAISFWDSEMRIVDCNQACVDLFGLPDRSAYIANYDKLSPEYQPNGRRSADLKNEFLNKAFKDGCFRFEWLYRNCKGEDIQCEVTLIRVDHHNSYMVASYVSDLRTLKAAQREREEAKIAIEAAKAKSKFLAAMSHEIRTPMNALLGIAETHIQRHDVAADMREAFDRIYNSAHSLLRIINDILDLSKIEAGKLEIVPAKYDLPSLLHDTAQLNMLYIGQKAITFKLDIAAGMPNEYIGDEIRIKQILNNLLSNAFKYTDKGEVELAVQAERTGKSDEVNLVFTVTDTGQGMSKEAVDSLFEEYTRFGGKQNRYVQGTGLGMNITRSLIKMMNADISVESEPWRGTRFCVRIPQLVFGDQVIDNTIRDNLQRLRLETTAQMRVAQIERDYMPYGKVLVVDDVETNHYVAKGLLLPYGLQIDTASSGIEAVEKIDAGKTYDIVFMDHMMPQMDGVEATRIIREKGYTGYVVALTANAIAGQREMFLSSGFDDFISKPIDTRQLNTILKKLIRDNHREEATDMARLKREDPKTFAKNMKKAESQGASEALADIFLRDATRTLAILHAIHGRQYSEKGDLANYVVYVHGLKSALANVGEKALSDMAYMLETAGRHNDMKTITEQTAAFLQNLRDVMEKHAQTEAGDLCQDLDYLNEKLRIIKDACEGFNTNAARTAVKALRQHNWGSTINSRIGAVAEHLLSGDLEAAAAMTDFQSLSL